MSHFPIFRAALGGVLESMLIQAWTAYEVLAEDLLNKVFKYRPSLNSRASWTNTERGSSGFRSRSKIANYYRFTFRNDNASIISVVDSGEVHSLGIMRNVLVHSGGRIDPIFKRDRLAYSALNVIKGKNLGYRIKLTGPLTRYFIDPVTIMGFSLAKSVDEWLSNNR